LATPLFGDAALSSSAPAGTKTPAREAHLEDLSLLVLLEDLGDDLRRERGRVSAK
jgi:hypothetical protein